MQKVLAAHGASKVSAYVTHAVFPKRSWTKFVHTDGGKILSNLSQSYLYLAKLASWETVQTAR